MGENRIVSSRWKADALFPKHWEPGETKWNEHCDISFHPWSGAGGSRAVLVIFARASWISRSPSLSLPPYPALLPPREIPIIATRRWPKNRQRRAKGTHRRPLSPSLRPAAGRRGPAASRLPHPCGRPPWTRQGTSAAQEPHRPFKVARLKLKL